MENAISAVHDCEFSLIEMDQLILDAFGSIEVAIKMLEDPVVIKTFYSYRSLPIDKSINMHIDFIVTHIGTDIESTTPMFVWNLINGDRNCFTYIILSCDKSHRLQFPVKMIKLSTNGRNTHFNQRVEHVMGTKESLLLLLESLLGDL